MKDSIAKRRSKERWNVLADGSVPFPPFAPELELELEFERELELDAVGLGPSDIFAVCYKVIIGYWLLVIARCLRLAAASTSLAAQQ
jgi:hypothetical protein